MRLPLLILHIFGGTLGLLAGTIAMIARKGERIHRLSGNIFTLAMLTLSLSAFWLAILRSQTSNEISAVLTFYLIGSAWQAGRRSEGVGALEWVGLLVCLFSAAVVLTLGVHAVHSGKGTDNGAPAAMSFIFGAVLLLAAIGDMRVIARGGVSGRPCVVRHLWRMCFGLFIATGSFFLGQPQVFPVALRGSIYLIVPAVLPLPLLIFWVIRVRFPGAYCMRVPSRGAGAGQMDLHLGQDGTAG